MTSRRGTLQALGGALVAAALPPARATPDAMRASVAAFTGGAVPRESGLLRLEVPELVENGNSVPVSVSLDVPMTEREHARRIALFAERNPSPQVAVFRLGPRSGAARVGTRIRMADSQRVVAVAELADGSFVQRSVDVVVTLAACIEN